MGVLQKFRAGSDVAVAEFVEIPIGFHTEVPETLHRLCQEELLQRQRAELNTIPSASGFLGEEFKISKLVFPPIYHCKLAPSDESSVR